MIEDACLKNQLINQEWDIIGNENIWYLKSNLFLSVYICIYFLIFLTIFFCWKLHNRLGFFFRRDFNENKNNVAKRTWQYFTAPSHYLLCWRKISISISLLHFLKYFFSFFIWANANIALVKSGKKCMNVLIYHMAQSCFPYGELIKALNHWV